jgi:hypothetical protein
MRSSALQTTVDLSGSRVGGRVPAMSKCEQTIQIAAVRMAGGTSHQHVSDVRWRSASARTEESTLEAIVAWLCTSCHNHAVVANGRASVAVAVVLAPDERPYLRTCADGVWTDHLLALPTF